MIPQIKDQMMQAKIMKDSFSQYGPTPGQFGPNALIKTEGLKRSQMVQSMDCLEKQMGQLDGLLDELRAKLDPVILDMTPPETEPQKPQPSMAMLPSRVMGLADQIERQCARLNRMLQALEI